MADKAGDRIGRYEVLAQVGRGAMGTVYKARDPQLDRIVAIKTLRVDLDLEAELRADSRKRFYQEAMAAGRLNHPAIVAIYDVVEVAQTPYIVMEFVEGRTLAQVVAEEGPLPPGRAVEIVRAICEALEYAHARGIVHRDIKPANILVGESGAVKVSDFGIARIAGKKFTQTGMMLGSPSYMSPEQVKGREVDGRSDLFSLGVVLYEALSGADAFPGDHPSTVLYHIVHEDPVAIPERNPSVSPALDAVIRRVLAKEPDQRYPTARAFAEALRQALERGEGRAPSWREGTIVLECRPPRTRRRLVVLGSGCLLVCVAGGAVLWGPWVGRGRPASEVALTGATLGLPLADPSGAGSLKEPARIGPLPDAGESAGDARPGTRKPEGKGRDKVPSPMGGTPTKASRGAGRPRPVAVVPLPGQGLSRAMAGLGSVRIETNPLVEVLVDGQLRGRARNGPLVLSGIPLGERLVTLRLGPVEQRFLRTFREGETVTLRYHFPGEPR